MLSSSENRRDIILKNMQALIANDIHCQGCPGTCCTFRANSMQITPQEGRDILHHLQIQQDDLKLWQSRWQNCIEEFRLDVELCQGARALRKTYTCPFFSGGPHGCQLPPEVKPYGCLAFNPQTSQRNEENQGIDCQTAIETHAENELLETFPLSGQRKRPIPMALLELAQYIANQSQALDSL
jgi:Fe-S-cluster containining protein